MIQRKEQFTGCLIGQCLGDALGFVVEGYSPAACKRYVEDILKAGRAGEFGRFPFPFGQYSDDSQLARELLQSYVACKSFDPYDYAERIKAIFLERRIVGWGYSTKEAALRLIHGVPWQESGTPAPFAGNGSAMRAAPIGLFFFDNTQLMIQAAYSQGCITHKDSRCSAGAVAISGAVALVLQGKQINPDSFLSSLSDLVKLIEPTFSAELIRLIKWISMPPDKAIDFISQAGIESDYLDEDEWQGISPFVVSSVLWSLYSFLRAPDDYWETIYTAIEVGGDVDTTAAMAGAISGSYLGLNAIPSNLFHHLTDRGTWRFDELVELATQCYEIKMKQI
ncbi:MAG: ADP-ribosylglycohydrolase family protein [Nitrospirota bacterium]|nr:ADP-ribosylglycohydrolase family protein [Nitrospirota bacterium]MDH5768182.1 ADP-ribosylglycohydrolase family protein [Nitrospirota bacterium]